MSHGRHEDATALVVRSKPMTAHDKPSAAKSILFADDSEDDRFLMLEAAKSAGVASQFAFVVDGEEAVSYLEKWPAGAHGNPRLALLDINMPRKNGFETLEWIRGSKRWAALPVLMLTASAEPSDMRASARLGANAYLIKPVRLEELVELIAAINAFWLRFTDYRPH